MSRAFHIVVCSGIVPDPLQTLEPVQGPTGPSLKNELMLPAVLDPWAGHALYEAAHLAKTAPGSKVWLVSLGPKAKLQQVMMTVAQKVSFELVALDGPGGGFTESSDVAAALADAIQAIPGLDRSRLLVFGGWESASRAAGSTLQQVGERLGLLDQFQGVDQLRIGSDGALQILERVEGGKHQISNCAGPPALLAWATGSLPEPPRQSPSRDGQYADGHAGLAASQAGKGWRRGCGVFAGGAARSATGHADRQGPVPGRDRPRDRGVGPEDVASLCIASAAVLRPETPPRLLGASSRTGRPCSGSSRRRRSSAPPPRLGRDTATEPGRPAGPASWSGPGARAVGRFRTAVTKG